MEFLKNTFLFRVYRADKLLFVVFSFFLFATILYTRLQREEFPILLYGMYSLKEYPQSSYRTYSIFIDGKEVDYAKLKDSQREMILSPLIHTADLMKQGKLTKEQKANFEKWLFTYSVDMRGLETNKMDIYEVTCTYKETGLPEIINKELLFSYAIN